MELFLVTGIDDATVDDATVYDATVDDATVDDATVDAAAVDAAAVAVDAAVAFIFFGTPNIALYICITFVLFL